MDNDSGAWAFILANLFILLVLWLLVFGVLGGIAALVAPRDRRWTFFLVTFFLFGPIGIALASVANPRDRKPPLGTRDYYCRRCDARNFVGFDDDTYQCWRCGRDHGVLTKAERDAAG